MVNILEEGWRLWNTSLKNLKRYIERKFLRRGLGVFQRIITILKSCIEMIVNIFCFCINRVESVKLVIITYTLRIFELSRSLKLKFNTTKLENKESSYEILGIDRFATLEQTRKAYLRLSYINKGSPETLLRLNDAYKQCKATVNFEIYTPELFTNGYTEYAKDFFDRLIEAYDIKCAPRFTDAGFNYVFWRRFRHYDSETEKKMLKIVKYIQMKDPRFTFITEKANKNITVNKAKGNATTKISNKYQNTLDKINNERWLYYCKKCNRKFNNKNTLKDHLASKKHKSQVKHGEEETIIENPNAHISDEVKAEVEVKNKNDATASQVDSNPKANSYSIIKEEDSNPNDGDIKSKTDFMSSEHKLYRTCGICKELFDSRGKLIVHIKEKHS